MAAKIKVKEGILIFSTGFKCSIYSAFIFLVICAGANASNIYVSTTGNDTSGSGSSVLPYATINKGLTMANAGDSVVVSAGNYGAAILTKKAGTSSARITVRAATVGTATVTVAVGGSYISHAYISIEDIVFDGNWGTLRLLIIQGNSGVVKNCIFRNNKQNAIEVNYPATNNLIENCQIYNILKYNADINSRDAHAITGSNTTNLTIKGCTMYQFSGDAVQFDPDRLAPPWNNVLIENCTAYLEPLTTALATASGWALADVGKAPGENFIDTKTPGPKSSPVVSYGTYPRSKLTIRNCVAYGFKNAAGGAGSESAVNLKEYVDCTVDRLTVYDCYWAFRLRWPALVMVTNSVVFSNTAAVRYEDKIDNLHIYNLTFGKSNTSMIIDGGGAGGSLTDLQVRNCLFFGSKPAAASHSSNLTATAASFVNTTTNDYHLVAGAAAIDKGITLSTVTADRDGIARAQGSAYDVGAYEWYTGTPGGGTRPPSETSLPPILPLGYPNPINFGTGGTFKLIDLPTGSVVTIYHIAGGKIRSLNETSNFVEWDGTNEGGEPVGRGVYIYIVKAPDGRKASGKIATVR